MAKRTPSDKRPFDLANRVSLTISEAAEAMGISESHLRNHISEFPVVRLGEKPLIPIAALEKWFLERVESEREAANAAADSILAALRIEKD